MNMSRLTDPIKIIVTLLLAAMLASCGGGGDNSSNAPPANPTPPTVVVRNVQPISVDAGPANTINLLFTDVTICAPNSNTNCQTIDHVLVDTGSSGLRLIASQVAPALLNGLPQQIDSGGRAILECTQFADGFSWGTIRAASVALAGLRTPSIPIQIIGDPNFPAVPADCQNSGPAENTVQSFGANGVIGVGNFIQDCGPVCEQNSNVGIYYSCGAFGCTSITQPVAAQVTNPVAMFDADNNGVLISLPALPVGGATRVDGAMIFGIQTQANNVLGNARILTLNPNTGVFTTVFNNRNYPNSFLDSGSNALYLPDTGLPRCSSGFFCPTTTQTFSALNRGTNGISTALNFNIANADQLRAARPSRIAFSDLAGPSADSSSFDWGLPFFFGRTVFTAFENRGTGPGGNGPYVAY